MIELRNISKRYDKTIQAVSNVSLKVKEGELFGLIGPDGAGKTSIFRILATLLKPDTGFGTIDGLDIVKDYRTVRNMVGYMPGKFSLYQDLTVEENLKFFATLFETTLEENYDFIKEIYVQIEKFKTRKAGNLSGGMKQKLALCCALIHQPAVLFLDEPTTGVDPVSRKEFWEMLKRLKEYNITIMVATPYMDEAVLCDRIALMQEGQILSVNTPARIIASYPDKLYAIKGSPIHLAAKELKEWSLTKSCHSFGDSLHVTFNNDESDIKHTIESYLAEKNIIRVDIKQITPTVEDCFIRYMEQKPAIS